MPTAGGLAIFLSFSLLALWEFSSILGFSNLSFVLLGALIVVVTGLIDDIKELNPRQKHLVLHWLLWSSIFGQTLAF